MGDDDGSLATLSRSLGPSDQSLDVEDAPAEARDLVREEQLEGRAGVRCVERARHRCAVLRQRGMLREPRRRLLRGL